MVPLEMSKAGFEMLRELKTDIGIERDNRPSQACGALMSIAEAAEICCSLAEPVKQIETVDIASAIGRVLAQDLCAPRAMPFFDNSAMDGFAVDHAALEGDAPWTLPVVATAAAGAAKPVLTGKRQQAVRIFTGAPVPDGFDSVVVSEVCRDLGDTVEITQRPAAGDNIRRKGEDIARGARLVVAGTRLQARHIGLLAGNGYASVAVRRRVRIGIFSTGDELATTDSAFGAASIFDANSPMLAALCRALGAEVTDLGVIRDDRAAMTARFLSLSKDHDLVLSSGSASVGGRDFLREALLAANGRVEAARVALKPGKPVFFARLGTSLFTGLPGNPLSAYVGFQLFVVLQIARLAGETPPRHLERPAISGFELQRKPGRQEYVPVEVVGEDEAGRPLLKRLGQGSSASLMPLCQADGLAIIASATAGVCIGDPLSWIDLRTTASTWRIV